MHVYRATCAVLLRLHVGAVYALVWKRAAMTSFSDSDFSTGRTLARSQATRSQEEAVLQDAKHALQIIHSRPAGEALAVARRCINHVITSYGSKCAEAEEYDRQAQEAVISRISYKERGSQSNWPDSHLPYVSTLNRLVEENSSLKDKVKNGAEYRFYAGIFNQLNKHLQQGGNNDFEYQRKWHELKQFQASLYSQNPAAFDRLMLGQTLDAQSRRLDYEVFLRHCQERRMHDQTQQCNLVSADKAADFTKQVTELQKSMNILSQENLDLKSAVNSMKQPLQSLKVPARPVQPDQASSPKIAAYKPAAQPVLYPQRNVIPGQNPYEWQPVISKSHVKREKRKEKEAAKQDALSSLLPQPRTRAVDHTQRSQQTARNGSRDTRQYYHGPHPRSRFSNNNTSRP